MKLVILILFITYSLETKFFVKYEEEGTTAIITINHPQSFNVLNTQILDELDVILDMINLNKIRSIIITGSGEKSFISGFDITEMSTLTKQRAEEFSKKGNNLFRKIETFPIPVIAAINGFALGEGLELSMSCDIRICSENAIFGQPEVGLGIIPGFGGTQRLSRIVGLGIAKLMIYTGKNINADEALRIGLVSGIYPKYELLNEAKKIAELIAKNSPDAVKKSKQAINEGIQMDLDKAIELEEKLFAECFETSEQIERMKKFGNKGEKEIKEEEEEEEKKEDEDTPIIPKELLEAKDKNFIVATFEIWEHKTQNLINSYERFYRNNNHKLNYVEYNEKLENEKQITNAEIYINGKIIYDLKYLYFKYRYEFENPGKYTVVYNFKKPLTSAAFLFYQVNSMISIDLSHFDSSQLQYTSSMFQFCGNLENINFSNFNTNNLLYTDEMFYGCRSLKLIDLPNLNLSKINNSREMFYRCNAKVNTKDS